MIVELIVNISLQKFNLNINDVKIYVYKNRFPLRTIFIIKNIFFLIDIFKSIRSEMDEKNIWTKFQEYLSSYQEHFSRINLFRIGKKLYI